MPVRPVMINLAGHTIVGVGYADPSTIYIHDTWDSSNHTMTWGGSYAGMEMVAVSIVNLAPIDPYSLTVTGLVLVRYSHQQPCRDQLRDRLL